MKSKYLYSLLAFCIVIIIIGGYFYLHYSVTTIVLVRHTEKMAVGGTDPPLSPEGIARAQELSHVVESMGINVIFATEFQRTQATVAPTASKIGITPIILSAADTQGLIRSLTSEYKGKVILIAGHSNTVPALMSALGVSTVPVIADNIYDNLFVVHVVHSIFRHAKLTHLKYGDPSI